jgi:hypothetical protein
LLLPSNKPLVNYTLAITISFIAYSSSVLKVSNGSSKSYSVELPYGRHTSK